MSESAGRLRRKICKRRLRTLSDPSGLLEEHGR